MGLDIVYYPKIKKVEDPKHYLVDDYCEEPTHRYVSGYTFDDFPDSHAGLESGTCYEVLEEGDSFRAGSYSGYNFVRDEFSKAVLGVPASFVWANLDAYRGKPLFELINMSDCEGYISGQVAAKLFKDFEDNREKVEAIFTGDEEWLLDRWNVWTECFRIASPDGLVVFC